MGARTVYIAEIGARPSTSSLPHGYMRPSGPRAAFSHSASLGNRLPAQVQYALRLEPVHPDDGVIVKFRVAIIFIISIRAVYQGSLQAPAATHKAYCLLVTSYLSIQYPSRYTVCWGFRDRRDHPRWFACILSESAAPSGTPRLAHTPAPSDRSPSCVWNRY